jgi:hypothetical protein
MATYSQTTNKRIQSRLHKRYHTEISALQKLGFHHLAYCIEDHGPYSALTQFLVIPLALRKGELLVIKWPFRLASANILMATEYPASIALCMGMGTKIYSAFAEGTVVISSDFMSSAVPRPGAKLIRLPPQPTLAETWAFHKAEVLRKSREVDFLSETMTFGDYVLMSGIEEDPAQYIAS